MILYLGIEGVNCSTQKILPYIWQIFLSEKRNSYHFTFNSSGKKYFYINKTFAFVIRLLICLLNI